MDTALQLPRTLAAPGVLAALSDELAALDLQRPLIVTDAGVVRTGLVDRLHAALDGRVSATVFDAVTENNVFADADGGAALFRHEGCDSVIAFGGGSVIDTAKCIAVLAAGVGCIADYALHPDIVIAGAVPIVAIPTTAGTGSEADIYAGIHADSTSIAAGIASRHIMPRLVLLDAELTLSLPPRATAATGIDALSHCIEGYLSKFDVPFAKLIALDGVTRSLRFIKRAVADGNDLEARTEMQLAAYAGGVAISMGTGPAHAIALSCSDQGFPHGILSGIGLVATLDVIGSHQPERLATLKAAMSVPNDASAGDAVATLMRELGLPATLTELGYRVDSLDELARLANENFCNSCAVHHPSIGQYRALLSATLQVA